MLKRRVNVSEINDIIDENTILYLRGDSLIDLVTNTKVTGSYSQIVNGKFNKALRLDEGSKNRIVIPDYSWNNTMSEYSIDFWIYNNNKNTDRSFVSSWGKYVQDPTTSTNYPLFLGNVESINQLYLTYKSNEMGNIKSNLVDGTWNHVGIVYDGDSLSLHVNGSKINTLSNVYDYPRPYNGVPLYINYKQDSGDYGSILIERFRISNIARDRFII